MSVAQTVDMTDRSEEHNAQQWPIIQDKLNEPNGLIFITKPMKETQQLAGAITEKFIIAVNKKDVGVGYNIYEIMEKFSTSLVTKVELALPIT
jgi:hypothetical protein